MKKIISAFALVLLTGTFLSAQSVTAPKSASKYLTSQYSGVQAEWTFEGDQYEAAFTYNNTEMEVVFDKSGNLVETQTRILWAEVPQPVMYNHKTSQHGTLRPDNNWKIVAADGTTTYLLKLVDAAGEAVDMHFAADGTILSTH